MHKYLKNCCRITFFLEDILIDLLKLTKDKNITRILGMNWSFEY